eukprot:CAMPEP_0182920698 /NCGR_PEP_ID=MMETSP0105_2-20130417/3658_1 /TAXON_ID=81532 ORGANISM="Acanthoeca-like sp., Strain 10tr" /NCGR_SAMPLE_ID=MMETSP0105_2 /ASSEMBLY_ACC=CAM_ASM_000205 /LENGTH=109 /DNA_ID=CAMNT_0025058143 /DNA_START=492 /DNA_END=817 /DNA_ORIENTATION=-
MLQGVRLTAPHSATQALTRPSQVDDEVRGALPRWVLVCCTDVTCVCLQDEAAGAAAAADYAGAADSAAVGAVVDPPVERPWLWASAADWLQVHKGGKWASTPTSLRVYQ